MEAGIRTMGDTTWMTRRDDRSKNKNFFLFFNSKPITKIGFKQMHNCERSAINLASSRTGVRQNSATKISKSGEQLFLMKSESKPKFFVFKTDFQNRFWTGSRLQQINALLKKSYKSDREKKKEKRKVRWWVDSFFGIFNSSRFQK